MKDLREQLLKEHSKTNCNRIVQWINNDQDRFDQLFLLFISNEYRVVQRAAWPISFAVMAHPLLIKKHLKDLLTNLKKPGIHNAVKRNTVRLLQDVEIPEKYHGEVMDICFRYISSVDEPIAVKAFSLSILEKLVDKYPEIKNELKVIIEERWNYETAAFHSRAKKILKKM